MPDFHDHALERQLLTAIALEPGFYGAAAHVAPDDFHLQAAGQAWASIQEAQAAGQAILPGDYRELLTDDVALDAGTVEELARRLVALADRRRLLAGAQGLAQAIYGSGDTAAALDDLDRLRYGRTRDSLVPMADAVQEAYAATSDPDSGARQSTGLPALDVALGGGVDRGLFLVVMARPSMGKTSALVQMADEASAAGARVLVFSKEMTRAQWANRTAARRARINLNRITRGDASAEEIGRYVAEVNRLAARRHFDIDDSTPQTTGQMVALCERRAREWGGIDFVLTDHLRLFADKADNETHRLGAVSWAHKMLAKRLGTRVIAAAQLSRAVEGQADPRPDLKDLRDSGEIEENADIVIGLFRPKYYDPKADETAEFIVRKNRDGERNARARFVFMQEWMGFEPIQEVPGGNGRAKTPAKAAGNPAGWTV